MTLKEVRDYLAAKIECPRWYVGKIQGNEKYCAGVYPAQGPDRPIPIGGLKNRSYDTMAVSVLIHWGSDSIQAEKKAREVYDLLYGQTGVIGGCWVVMFDMRTDSPVGVGTDERGIYEFVINFVIYYGSQEREAEICF